MKTSAFLKKMNFCGSDVHGVSIVVERTIVDLAPSEISSPSCYKNEHADLLAKSIKSWQVQQGVLYIFV